MVTHNFKFVNKVVIVCEIIRKKFLCVLWVYDHCIQISFTDALTLYQGS